jgi:hypothetical protein
VAQVTISEEHFRELLALAQKRGMTPDALIDELMDDLLTVADQRAFWGDIHEEMAQAEAEIALRPPRYLTEEEFFAELEERPTSRDSSNADI